jgi:hypothetical protein
MAAGVPSAGQRGSHRGAALLEAYGRPAWEITPAAAGDQDIAQRVDDLAKRGMRYAATPLRRLQRNNSGRASTPSRFTPRRFRRWCPPEERQGTIAWKVS